MSYTDKNMRDRQKQVLQYLDGRDFCGPSEIARAVWVGKKNQEVWSCISYMQAACETGAC